MKKVYRLFVALLGLGGAVFFVGDVVDDLHAHDAHDQAVLDQDQRRLDELLKRVQSGAAQGDKAQEVITLVKKGVAHLANNSIEDAMHDFTFNPHFTRGESYLFAYDLDGVCWAHGRHQEFIWMNRYDTHDSTGFAYVQKFIEIAQSGGGWVTYMWRNALKRSYVTIAQHGEKSYIVGAGYYSHAAANAVVDLIRAATDYFNQQVSTQGADPEDVFATLNRRAGTLVRGGLYLFAIDMKDGTVMAHSKHPHLVGSDAWDYEDGHGVFVNKEIAKKLAQSSGGVWQSYMSHNAPKVAYAQKVVDGQGRSYFIASGYYPEMDEDKVVELVRKGHQHLKTQGPAVTRLELQDEYQDAFRYGDLALTVYDLKGNVIASGRHPQSVGSTIAYIKDDAGNRIFSHIQHTAAEGGGWISVPAQNAHRSLYVEPVQVGERSFIITSSIYPLSPEVEIEIMVKLAIGALKREPLPHVLAQFSDLCGPFIRGDMMVYVITEEGIVLAWGDETKMLWKRMIDARDDNNRPFIRMLIEATKAGPVQISFTINGVARITYAQSVEIDERTYVVGSAFFV